MGATVHRLQTKHKNKPTLAITYKVRIPAKMNTDSGRT
jgi:hypothetical protein